MNSIRFIFISIALLTGILFNSCKKEHSCQSCPAKKPPVAIAGTDEVITLPTDSVFLNGSASSDPDGTITSHSWKKINGPASYNINSATTATTLVKNLITGNYEFELTVTDNDGLTDKDSVRVQVIDLSPNRPPIANAGPNQTLTLPVSTANLDGSASTDPDYNITGYAWSKISGPAYFNITNQLGMQTTVDLAPGIYQIELKVTDAAGLFSLDTMEIKVNPGVVNQLPVANAGTDATFTFDLQTCSFSPVTTTLNGSGSIDPDGNITQYTWSGPGLIANPHAAITTVSGLLPGMNFFFLTVRDNAAGIDVDTMLVNIYGINRSTVNAQLVPFGTLTGGRINMAAASLGNKLLFAGGYDSEVETSVSMVDIFDLATNTKTTASLTVPKHDIAVTTCGNKIFFGGGYFTDSWTAHLSNHVDIFDVSTGAWTRASLSNETSGLAAASVGDKVFFAGGSSPNWIIDFYNTVDIYNLTTNTWSTATLTQARGFLTANTSGNKIYFAGGMKSTYTPSDRVDVYDNSTGTWGTSTLNLPRQHHASIAENNQIYWAGGDNIGLSVEIFDPASQTSSLTCLSQPVYDCKVVRKFNKLIFFAPSGIETNKFDIYDLSTHTWSIGLLDRQMYGASIIAVNNIVYVAGGIVNNVLSNQVWKLEF
ncbi:MAG TPA: PKD domain-containing protein [Chitinophagaceae bacterium]|nr:PKD domain-containing protein [Chitinophagaceae bacterium]